MFGAEQGRAYPTTPSTFPQPVYTNSNGQQEVWGTQSQQNSGFNQQGYFANNAFTPGMQQQQTNNLQTPSAAYRAPQGQQGLQGQQGQYSDPTNNLAQQFSHQNLGGNAPRAQSPYGRQPSANARPRTGASNNQQQLYGSYLGAPQPVSNQPSLYDEEPPVKNPERFSTSISSRAKLQTELVGSFFKDSVERARDRNGR